MEAIAAQSISYCVSQSFLYRKSPVLAYSAANVGFRRLRLQCVGIKYQCTERNVGIVQASSDSGVASVGFVQGWLLEPVGDGNYKHIGYKVDMPGAYEIFSQEMIVGRVPGKADLVIPVATVSGLHARIINKEGSLLVTDLDSTNGTFINEKRVPPGATAIVPLGSLLTFGDTHLAIFRVSRVEKTIEDDESVEPQDKKSESNGSGADQQPESS